METDELSCAQDGVPTRLRCAKCGKGICPACMVRTPVGYDCPTCAGGAEGGGRRRPSPALLIGGAVVVALVLVGITLSRSPSAPASDPVGTVAAAGETTPIREAMIGEEARDGQLSFVVQDFSCSTKDATTGQLCRLQFTVKNVSGGPATFLGKFQYLVDGQHKVYGADTAMSGALPENASRSIDQLTVNPDVVMPVVLVYDLPETVQPAEAQFKGTGASGFGVNVRLERRS